MNNEINNIRDSVGKVVESLSHFMESGHLADNVCNLTTNASVLNVLANKLNAFRDGKNNNHNVIASNKRTVVEDEKVIRTDDFLIRIIGDTIKIQVIDNVSHIAIRPKADNSIEVKSTKN
jgi:hypothetical protein